MTAPKAKHRVPDVVKKVREYCAKPGNRAGGSLHVVLEDMNVSDDFVRGCMNAAVVAGDVQGATLALTLLECSKSQRRRIAMTWDRKVETAGSTIATGGPGSRQRQPR